MPKIRKRIFFDLDNTLYDTRAQMAPVQEDMERLGARKEDIVRTQRELSAEGYSFEEHLRRLGFSSTTITERANVYRRWLASGDRYLLPGVREGFVQLAKIAECHLLTFGLPRHQRQKVRGIASLQGLFTAQHYVWRHTTKGDVVRRYGDQADTYFIDDIATHLEDVRQKAPWTTCVRMEWPEKETETNPDDEKKWPVIHSLEALIALVQGSRS